MPYASCSAANQPEPSPSSTRPRDIVVHLRHRDREGAGEPERRRGHQRAEPDPRGLPASAPSVTQESVGPGSPDASAHHQEVVGAEERVVARRLGGPRDAQLVVVAGPHLGLGEDPQVHAATLRKPATWGWTGGAGVAWRRDDRTGGSQAAASGGPQRRDPDRTQAAVDPHPRPHRPAVHRAEGARPLRRAAHRLRGGGLPQHLRVLGRPRGHVPHRRRAVHPALRLLPDRHRQARRARPRRAPPGRRVGAPRWGCATPPSPASPATTCPTAAPGSTPRPSARSTS